MFTENRTVVPLKSMAPHLAEAFVAAEDGRFFEHPGLDLVSVLRALVNNIRTGEKSQGGSTITQQVAKSLLLSPEKTYIRKFKEAILAYKIDKVMTKKEILYIYLNQIYLGEGAYGVEAAAQKYFGKSASELSLGECALLAGLPQAPSRYALRSHLDRAVVRQRYVLNRMADDGYIKASQARAAYKQKIVLVRHGRLPEGDQNYYLDEVKKQARRLLGRNLQTAGARIYSNYDPKIQQAAVSALRHGMKEVDKYQKKAGGKGRNEKPQAALVAIETRSGRVVGLVGGRSYKKSPFNRASQAKRPAGSTFKPFVYAAAMEMGMTPATPIDDSPISIKGADGKMWRPKNYGGKYYGPTSLNTALTHSLNGATVRLMKKTGYRRVHDIAIKAGLRAQLPPDLSLSLGAVDVSLLDMVGAYTVFAGNGTYTPPRIIDKIVTGDGKLILPPGTTRSTALSRTAVGKMKIMLKSVVQSGTGRAVKAVPNVQGGKTGTSDENRDAWFIGFDNRITAGVWVGYDHNRSLGKKGSGGQSAAPIWREFMLGLQGK